MSSFPQRRRKDFFFKKKKQKTFINLGQWRFHHHGLDYQKFFARPRREAFFQKSATYLLPIPR